MKQFSTWAKTRLTGYTLYGLGSLIVTYCATNGYIGADEVAIWTGIGALFSVTAATNVQKDKPEYEGEHVLDPLDPEPEP